MVSGVPSVTTTGAMQMPRLSAGSLDYQPEEHRLSPTPTLDGGRDRLFSTTFGVLGTRRTSQTAKIMDCLFTTVHIMRMLELGAGVRDVRERERRERGRESMHTVFMLIKC